MTFPQWLSFHAIAITNTPPMTLLLSLQLLVLVHRLLTPTPLVVHDVPPDMDASHTPVCPASTTPLLL